MPYGKKIMAGLLPTFLVLVVLLAACGSGSGTSNSSNQKATADKQVFTSPISGISDVATLDPAKTSDLYSSQVINMVFTGLVSLDNSLSVKPQLAQSWDTSADGLTWTFHLKPNLKFSDNTPLTSADVAYSLDRALQPATKSTVAPIYLALIKDASKLNTGKISTIIGDSVKTPDPNTVQITISQKATYFLDALTYGTSYIVEKSMIEKYGANFTDHLGEGGGAGPFKIQSYQHSKQITLVPNPNYYGSKPQLSKVIIPFYKDPETAYQAYKVGQVDVVGVPSAHEAQAKTSAEHHATPQLSINYYTMNYLVKPFDSLNMRKAFEAAINKDEIVHAVWKDAFIASNHIIPKGMPGYSPDLKGVDGTTSTKGNATAAKQFLADGLKDESVTSVSQLPAIKLTYPSGSADADNEVAALVQMWQNTLGISVKPDPVDFNKLLDETTAATNNANGLQFWGLGWIADYPDPQDWTTLQFSQGSNQNNMNYGQNKTTDAAQQQALQQALVAADSAPEGQARLQVYMNAEQQLVNDVAWLPMEQQQSSYLLKSFVQGYTVNAQNLVPPDYWSQIYVVSH